VAALRILIAEDDSVTVLSLKGILEKLGHTVIAAAGDGVEAIRLAEKVKPDLIMMDIIMSGLDGIEAARAIMNNRPVPIIMLTAYSEGSLITRASEAGVTAYLVKPVTEADLRPAITLARDRFQEQQALTFEVCHMRESLESRKLVDKAKRILVERCGLSEQEAHRRMVRLSRDRNIKMAEIAKVIISSGGLFAVPPD